MRQDAFFETVDFPLADLFEAAEKPHQARQCVPATQATAGPSLPTRPASEPPRCLRCGKACSAMFCNAKCRAAWIGGMNAWNARLARTTITGEQALLTQE